MAVKTYSMKTDKNKQLSPHFKVREFACPDGTDKVLISEELVAMLEKLRSLLAEKKGGEVKININSGYRTPSHNAKVGGSSTSQHKQGKAADIVCYFNNKIVQAKEVCAAAQDLNFNGIAYITSGATHVDVRGYRWWADETKGNKKVSDFYAYFKMPYPEPTETVKRGDKGTPVRWVQDKLNKAGYKLDVDGSFGGATGRAVKKFQAKNCPPDDERVGPATRKALKKY